MNLALWICAGVLAAVCLVGSAKMFVPQAKLAAVGSSAQWVLEFSPGALKAIGAVELLAAVGLILPAALDIAPVQVPLAATGLVVLFACAATMRLRRGERATIAGDLVYLVLAVFVAWGRFGPAPFTG
ncbi:DoxX family protein [Actinomycetota bacterium Odt1-20B]